MGETVSERKGITMKLFKTILAGFVIVAAMVLLSGHMAHAWWLSFPGGSVDLGYGRGAVSFPYGSVAWGPRGGIVFFPGGGVSWGQPNYGYRQYGHYPHRHYPR